MQITVLAFAMMRELLGSGRLEIEIPEGSTADALLPTLLPDHPDLPLIQQSVMLMVNEEYAKPDQTLQDGDEVALIPPVSGGDHRFVCTENELDPRAVEALVTSNDAGALVTFVGTVRDHARGKQVLSLEYEAYPAAAEKALAQVGAEVQEQWPAVRIAISHRFGHLHPGDASVVIACSSAHRDDAYAASAWAISRVKQIVPIWKKEHYIDGSAWIGSEHAYQVETGRIVAE